MRKYHYYYYIKDMYNITHTVLTIYYFIMLPIIILHNSDDVIAMNLTYGLILYILILYIYSIIVGNYVCLFVRFVNHY